MYGRGFTETLDNPNPGKLQLQLRHGASTITIWEHSADEGVEWQLANVYIGKLVVVKAQVVDNFEIGVRQFSASL